MAGRRKREQFDELLSRVLLILLGVSALFVSCLIIQSISSVDDFGAAFVGLFLMVGLPLVTVGLIRTEKTECAWENDTGNHEILIVFLLTALGVVYVIRKLKNEKA